MKKEEIVIHNLIHKPRTLGQKAADNLTKWSGSWTFIIILFLILIFWVILNIYAIVEKWDPYPFMLLNLVLGFINVILAPIILMSQNRQTQRDRLKAEFDYSINKKAEKEIREIKEILIKKLGR
jgi:uncharacterized membrane protein